MSKPNDKSQLLSDLENESIFSALGKGCQTLATAVAQLFLAEVPNREKWSKRCCGVVCFVKDFQNKSYFIRVYDPKSKQLVWEQELYTQFKYKTPREYFHTFEAHDCQAGLNFASEDEAAKFKKIVEEKLIEKHKKRLEKKKQQGGGISPVINQHPGSGNISVGSGTAAAADSVTMGNKPPYNTVKGKKDKKGEKRRLTKKDISTPTDFRHVGHVGWDPSSGLNTKKLDPEMKALFEQVGIDEQSQVDEETVEFIYDFVDKHGGMNALRADLARRQPPPPPSQTTGTPPPVSRGPPPRSPAVNRQPFSPVMKQKALPPTPNKGPVPLPPVKAGIRTATPGKTYMGIPPPPPATKSPFSPSIDAGPPSRPGGGIPPPPPPPPPPSVGVGGPPDAPSGRAALLHDIHKGLALNPVQQAETVSSLDARGKLLKDIESRSARLHHVDTASIAPAQDSPSGIVGALFEALKERATAIQGSDGDDDDSDDDIDDDDWDE